MLEPGLNRHDWETQWEDLEPLLEDSPKEALPEAVALVGRMLDEVGLDPDDETHLVEDSSELLLEFRRARETARALEAAEDVNPGRRGRGGAGLAARVRGAPGRARSALSPTRVGPLPCAAAMRLPPLGPCSCHP